jgi:hypothetical protein
VASDARETTQDTQRRTEKAPAKGGSFFTKKYGPLPGWGWSLLAGGGALAYFWWKHRSAQQAAATTTSTGSSTAYSGTGYAGSIAALQSEIQQLQGELSTTAKTTTTTKSTTAKPTRAPSGTRTSDITSTGATLTWEPLQPASAQHSYNVTAWHGTGPGVETKNSVHNSTSGATSVKLTGLTPGTGYGWHVRAENQGGDGPWSTIVRFTTAKAPSNNQKPAAKVSPGGLITTSGGGATVNPT